MRPANRAGNRLFICRTFEEFITMATPIEAMTSDLEVFFGRQRFFGEQHHPVPHSRNEGIAQLAQRAESIRRVAIISCRPCLPDCEIARDFL
jgi:hypothetical protein